MLAVTALDPTAVFVFYLLAVICFVLAALNVRVGTIAIGWLGLAFFAVPPMWAALAAT